MFCETLGLSDRSYDYDQIGRRFRPECLRLQYQFRFWSLLRSSDVTGLCVDGFPARCQRTGLMYACSMAVPWICSFWIWGIERDFDGIEGQPSSDTCRRTCVRMCYKGAVVVACLPRKEWSDMTPPKGTLWLLQYFQGWWSMLSWPKQNTYKNASQVCDSNGFNLAYPVSPAHLRIRWSLYDMT